MDHGAVNKSLEANRALLAKRKRGKLSFVSSTDETNRFTKKATPKQLKEIRDRIQKEEKQELKKIILITIVALIIVYFIATAINWDYWFFKSFRS